MPNPILKNVICLLLFFLSFPFLTYTQPIPLKATSDFPKWKTTGISTKLSTVLNRLAEEYRTFQSAGFAAGTFQSKNQLVQSAAGEVLIEAVARGEGTNLLKALEELGLQGGVVYQRIVNGRLPLEALLDSRAFEAIPELVNISIVPEPYQNVGVVTSQGDFAQNSDWVRDFFNVNGQGITVGVISDSYNYLSGAASGVSGGDLPGSGNPNGFLSPVNVLQDYGTSDEGRAIAEIVHDVAPGAKLAFHTGVLGQADFANGIQELIDQAFCDIIIDDLSYLTAPFFQDGIIAQTVDQAFSNGVAYFSSAGNYRADSYQAVPNPGNEFDITYTDQNTQITYEFTVIGHDFGSGDYFQSITIPAGGRIRISLQWTDPFTSVSGLPGPQTDIDLFLVSEDLSTIVDGSINDNNNGGDAVEYISYGNSTGSPLNLNIFIGIHDGPTPALLKYIPFGNFSINEFQTNSSTCFGHSNAAGGIAVGASFFGDTPNFGTDPPELESFSSRGGTPVYFDISGNPVSPFTRAKPEIVAPDGADNSFFGSDFDLNGFNNFFGTSASAPHAAGIAALLFELNPELSPTQIEQALTSTAIDMLTAGFDFDSGYGLVNGFAAAAFAAACAPDLHLSAASSIYPVSSFYAKNTLTADLMVDADFSLRAGQQINLVAGFKILPGVNFSAAIDAVACVLQPLVVQTQPEQTRPFFPPDARPPVLQPTSGLNSGIYGLNSSPNPFHGQTTVQFELSEPQTVSLRIIDLMGNTVYKLPEGQSLDRGSHRVALSGMDLSAGFYFLVLDSGLGRESRPLIRQ